MKLYMTLGRGWGGNGDRQEKLLTVPEPVCPSRE